VFIKDLAAYERLSHLVVATEELLRKTLFGERKVAEVILGYEGNTPVAFALFFHNFSTFLGLPGIYLEDLFVKPEYRRKGYGKMMLSHLAQITVERNCGRLEWSVLDWNEPAIDFYRTLGAVALDDWTTFRITGNELKLLADTFP
jgi:GNAT superfamily N-acetyltransferase